MPASWHTTAWSSFITQRFSRPGYASHHHAASRSALICTREKRFETADRSKRRSTPLQPHQQIFSSCAKRQAHKDSQLPECSRFQKISSIKIGTPSPAKRHTLKKSQLPSCLLRNSKYLSPSRPMAASPTSLLHHLSLSSLRRSSAHYQLSTTTSTVVTFTA